MFPYWIPFLLFAYLALRPSQGNYKEHLNSRSWNVYWYLSLTILTLMIGLRHQVGGDWEEYLDISEAIKGDQIDFTHIKKEFLYDFINWFGANVWGGIYLVNTVCGTLFSLGLIKFCRIQPRPWLAMVVAVPYLITVVAMGYSRQGVAIGLVMWGFTYHRNGKTLKFLLFVSLAAMFHNSAIILFSLALFSKKRNYFIYISCVILSVFSLILLVMQDYIDNIISGYILAEMTSSGAEIRVAMNAFPSAVFLLFRKNFEIPDIEKKLWIWMAMGGIFFVVILIFFPASTFVDRIALYWIPLQIFVLSRLPDAIGGRGKKNQLLIIGVVAYSGLILMVWLLFANHAYLWIPYNFYPWVYLWR